MLRIDDKPLRYFLAVFEAGSIRAAADGLHIAPSAISRQIAGMEADLGVLLMERTKQGIRFTEAGRLVAGHARRRLELDDGFAAELAAAKGGIAGRVHVITGEGFVVDMMHHAVAALGTAFPDVQLSIDVGGTDRMMNGILKDAYDIGLVFNPPRLPELDVLAEAEKPLCVLVPPHHPLAGRSSCTLVETLDMKAALLAETFGVRKLIAGAEAASGLRIRPALVTDSINVAMHFVLAGCGITYLPAFAVSRQLRRGEVSAVPLSDPALAHVPSRIVVRGGRPRTGAVRAVAELMAARMEAFGAEAM
ncbi:transcriptional regulator [Tistrella bauzanensis]|uniref:Transcriptional regulator n=1 Tax=Tistrella bauzanensis TaxID=657419 RepID=A0ABQ1IL09_9PROT|nr:LysR family transcriptional regulator [Tistrella bauzanensis]GGB45631.1 transcriptional regulator [Tistrella bauzanensis]